MKVLSLDFEESMKSQKPMIVHGDIPHFQMKTCRTLVDSCNEREEESSHDGRQLPQGILLLTLFGERASKSFILGSPTCSHG